MNTATTTTTYPATDAGARAFLEAALALVESKSIREWVNSAHNRPLFEEEALARIRAKRTDVHRFVIVIVSLAMGL
jgi:hypothetical protein